MFLVDIVKKIHRKFSNRVSNELIGQGLKRHILSMKKWSIREDVHQHNSLDFSLLTPPTSYSSCISDNYLQTITELKDKVKRLDELVYKLDKENFILKRENGEMRERIKKEREGIGDTEI